MWLNKGWEVSALFDRLLDVFWKRSQPSVAPMAMLTPEWISERLHTRPVRHHAPKAVALAEPTHVLVADEPALPSSDDEFAIADTSHHGTQRPIEMHWLGAEPDVANASDMAAVEHIDTPASIITTEPDPTPVSADETTWAEEEDETPSIEAPSVEQPLAEEPPIRPIPRAQPSAEILAEFHAMMRQHFGREKPETVGASHDVLKILKLNEGEPIATARGALALEQQDGLHVTTEPENDSAAPVTASDPEPPVISIDDVTIDENSHAADKKNAPIAWKDRTVAEVIVEGECSVRLANCIAANGDLFLDWTVGEALAHRTTFAAALMQVRNVGRKTAIEALDALEAFALDPRIREDERIRQHEPTPVDPLSAFDPSRLDAPLRGVLEARHISVRLAHLLANGALDDLTVRHFFLEPDRVRARMMGCKNAGRKTVAEAFELLSAHVEALGKPDYDSASVPAEDEPPEGLTTRKWIEGQMAALPPNRSEVLRDRYGLDSHSPKTLQEIAERVHVTRERVRQVEAGAIRRLRKDGRSRAAFTRYLAEEREAQWATLFGQQSTVPDDEVSERFRKLNPWFLLAIDIVFEDGRDGYLSANAFKTPAGWFRSSDEAAERQRFDLAMSDILGSYRMPMPLDTLEEIASSLIPSLAMEGDGWAVHDGYIHTGYVGPKARRAGRMHSVARRIAKSGVFDIGTLIAEYRSNFPGDECGSRIFEMQANEAPHLFAPLFDGMWLCLDHSSWQIDPLPAPPFERGRVEETHFAQGSLGDLLMQQLVQFGPRRAIDLRRTIIETAQGSFSESSVGAVLISNPCFRRVAPGIFGLYTGTLEVPASIDAHLLEDRQCRAYCQARRSGAPQDYYPLWGAAYEMRLAIWARQHAPNDLYRSLMAVIDPVSWPAPPDTIAQFQALQSQEKQWEIGAERRLPLGHRFLDSGQFLSALTHLVVFGWISWVGVNRATGSKSDNHDAADVLAFLVMTGLVEPESDWQAPHYPTDLAGRLFLEARWERHLHGDEASGDEDVFGRLRTALYEAPPTVSRGWVDVEEFTAAMPAWRSDGVSTGKAFGGAQSRQPGLDADKLFESDDWGAAFAG